ncbi:MAG: cysG [Anaerosporomusa subterranea]|jgi:precorrin-2 dehydrogenase/sirohydrochlorin ferrochelatase|nr:cysG [Anaerosporomusa subterranea]
MRYYPINLDIAGRDCVVIGGGAVAERKVETLVDVGAAVTVISPQLTPVLAHLAANSTICWQQRVWQVGDLSTCFLAICATNDEAVNAAAAAEARQAGALVNVVDTPALCDFTLPALVSRGDLLITVSTGGASPILARRIREQIEQLYGEDFGNYLAELAAVREQMKHCLATPADREQFWRTALDAAAIELVHQGKVGEAKEKIRSAVSGTWTQS